ncbi:N-acetylmuramoyl-L-alanine amidase [Virgibacillus dokdonensis]|uniref:N-acetylmuramoyl-L-alanine amidase n=1 Tax=Virgibacillus dokdonensis TaxID=302167 RepID=UPI000E2A1D80|nr:N-acetylmuramoyl-L-alanine amidase [Virgibacillus dokdonensis]
MNKRIVVISILILLFTFNLDKPVSFAKQGTITEDNVHVRSGPGTEFQIITQIHDGTAFTFIKRQAEWVEIQLEDSNVGWVHAKYLSINDQVDTPSTITIPHENTQIRSSPTTDAPIANFAKKGSSFQVISSKGDWYEIQNKAIHGFVYKALTEPISLPMKESSFANKSIVIDVGHGGRDVGAIGASGVFEKDVAFLTAQELTNELSMLGANVRLTRRNDEYIPLNSRISYSNNFDTDVFISLHYNSVPNLPNVTGIESFYYKESNKKLATSIQKKVFDAVQADDRGTSFGDFLVLRQNLKPAILLELGFISNKAEEARLLTTMYQKKLVSGIIQGLGSYFARSEIGKTEY